MGKAHMTAEERFARIEHITAGLVEQRRQDREEYRALWRDTQRQLNEVSVKINDLTLKIADTNDAITRLAEETQRKIDSLTEADKKLGERIDALVSAIGQFIAGKKE
jgi:chromosome segregation ATPase